jgi:hypothetical protein
VWRIASGDDSYRHILLSMFHPATMWRVLVGGALVTVRNYVTERIFGLNWTGVGRYPTGVAKEEVERKRLKLAKALRVESLSQSPGFERMYSIKIKADELTVFRVLGKFGDSDRRYLKPRLVNIQRVSGNANEVGSTIRYDVPRVGLSFSLVLEKAIGTRCLLYRVREGPVRGGIVVFDIDKWGSGLCFLSTYVAFEFPKGRSVLARLGWWAVQRIFPAFVHDVVWNHALCELKHLCEIEDPSDLPGSRGSRPSGHRIG